MLLDVLELTGKTMENLQEIQQSSGFVERHGIPYLTLIRCLFVSIQRCSKHPIVLPAKSGTSQNCLAQKKQKFHLLENINSKMLSDPESWVVSNHLLSYQIASSPGL